MKIVKTNDDNYTLTLSYDELNIIYHCVGNYEEFVNSIMALNMGFRLTGAESCIWEKSRKLSKVMLECEHKLCSDLRFEGDYYD